MTAALPAADLAADLTVALCPGKIGPNAIIQLADVLHDRYGDEARRAALHAAGLDQYIGGAPDRMTDEREAAALHRAVMARHARDWDDLSWEAGERTAQYLLAHRIPRGAQWLLRRMPATWAARVLLAAIGQHAWTFAGSGAFESHAGAPGTRRAVTIAIAANPVAMPGCPWHRGVFTHLFRRLVSPHTTVDHETCCAHGDSVCRFVIRWG
jgi:divinyl protochlorophyllide a 8-vinyl-reductase